MPLVHVVYLSKAMGNEKSQVRYIPLTIIGFARLISGFLIGLHLLMHVKWIKNITLGIVKNS